MKELIAKDAFGIFADKHDIARANSLIVAEFFGKRHDRVLRAIANITDPKNGVSEDFAKHNFKKSFYTDSTGRKLPCYDMTRDGFTLLAMGFTGKKALQFKEAYIKRFNEMEKFIRTLVDIRQEFPLLTANIKLLHEHPKPYHFSNEADMLNRIVLGMTAKEFRVANGLNPGESIRPHLTDEQISILDTLQKIDIGLLLAIPDFNQRKRQLQWYLTQTVEGDCIAI